MGVSTCISLANSVTLPACRNGGYNILNVAGMSQAPCMDNEQVDHVS